MALIFSGQYVRFVSAFRASLPAHVDKWGASLKLLMGQLLFFAASHGYIYLVCILGYLWQDLPASALYVARAVQLCDFSYDGTAMM